MKINAIIAVTIMFISVCVGREVNVFEEAGIDEESRSVKKEIREDPWRAVENIQMDTSGWIPDSDTRQQDGHLPMKRRRLRKRKRRPQGSTIIASHERMEDRFPARPKRPQHLHERQDFRTQMEEDAKFRPNKRRRISPLYHDSFGDDKISVFQADEGVPENKASTETIPDLRTILKQAGGLSLSEILQQKNLSLSDLLKGEKEAILAITEKPHDLVITEYKNPVEVNSVVKTKKTNYYRFSTTENKNIQTTTEFIASERNNYEEVGHRVSIKPNNVIVVDYKPNIIGLDITTKYIDGESTTTNIPPKELNVEIKPKLKLDLPITSAKLNKILKSSVRNTAQNEISPSTLPPKAYRINVDELFGISTIKENAKVNNDDGPLRMSLDLNSVIEKNFMTSTKTSVESTTSQTIPEKLKTITAKDEILDVLKDVAAREHLKNILETRNMTINDLVEMRERGSSQRHLADLFHNKTKEPEAKDEPLIASVENNSSTNKNREQPSLIDTTRIKISLNKHELVSSTENNDIQYDRKAKSHHSMPLELKNIDNNGYSVSMEAIEESNESKSIEESKDKDKYTVTSFPTYKIGLHNRHKDKSVTPISDTWTNNFPDLFDDFYQRTHQKGTVEDLNENYFNEIRTIDDIENTISESGKEKLLVETQNKEAFDDINDNEIFIKLPYGVKHAILASLLIIGLSLVIFLTILMIFKWSQKHKKKFCYNGRFSCSKIKSPMLENSERRSFRTFMSETLGRKKHYYKQHLQRMSETIWENDRKPFQ